MKQYDVNDDNSIKFVRNNQQVLVAQLTICTYLPAQVSSIKLFGNNLYYYLDKEYNTEDNATMGDSSAEERKLWEDDENSVKEQLNR